MAKAKFLRVTMEDGSKWDVPVEIIARDRAKDYTDEFDGDVERSLNEDTLPLFDSDDYEIEDWAANNMNWEDVKDFAAMVDAGSADYQEGWINGDKEVVEKEVNDVPFEMKVEGLAESLHEAGRAAVEAGNTVAAEKFGEQTRKFIEWDELTEAAREGKDSGSVVVGAVPHHREVGRRHD